jgi:hypothetical protein
MRQYLSLREHFKRGNARDQALAVMCERPLNERDAGPGVASGSAKETEVRFAPDSPLEGAGFEPSVPHDSDDGFRSNSPA